MGPFIYQRIQRFFHDGQLYRPFSYQ
jgi:hypothetical protein